LAEGKRAQAVFLLIRQNKIHGLAWADQDWIGLMIFKNFAAQV